MNSKLTWHWQSMRPWFHPTVVKLLSPWFAILPILVSLFPNVPEDIVVGVGNGLHVRLELPFSWWVLWWGSLFYLAAYAMYLLWCPQFIRRYMNYSEYVNTSHSPRWMAHELKDAVRSSTDEARRKLFGRLIDKKLATQIDVEASDIWDVRVREDGTAYRFKFDSKNYEYLASENDAVTPAREREVFWEVFGPFASSYPGKRLIVWALLFLSMAAIVIVIFQNIASVWPYALRAPVDVIVSFSAGLVGP